MLPIYHELGPEMEMKLTDPRIEDGQPYQPLLQIGEIMIN